MFLRLYTGVSTWWSDLKGRAAEEGGATAVEYALMVALIAVVILAAPRAWILSPWLLGAFVFTFTPAAQAITSTGPPRRTIKGRFTCRKSIGCPAVI